MPSLEEEEVESVQVYENKLVVAASIVPFAIAGTLVRITITRLQEYPGAPVFSLVYAQWFGCVVMGIAVKYKDKLLLWYHPSHPAISTGFCGSFTTFSSWQLGIFKEFANYNSYSHTRGKNVLAALSELLVTLAMSFNGYIFGQHIGDILVKSSKSTRQPKVITHGFSTHYLTTVDCTVIIFGLLSWIGVILAAIFAKDQKELAMACAFAPLGALTRWYLSFLNGRKPHFPIGTFVANVFGTAVLAALTLVQSGPSLAPISCIVVQGLADGYCGCLTTISTFIVELSTLPRKYSYFYASASIIVAQCFMFVILGSYIWSQGLNPGCT